MTPQVRIVSSAEIAADPAQPLDARYWCERLDGEGYAAWRRRVKAEALDDRADRHEAIARRARQQAQEVRQGGAGPRGNSNPSGLNIFEGRAHPHGDPLNPAHWWWRP